MDFDEYEYLEKTVESSDLVKASNGSETRSRTANKRRSGDEEDITEDGHQSKRRSSRDDDRENSERSLDGRDRSHREKSRDRSDRERDRPRDRINRSYREPEREHRDGERRRHGREHDRGKEHERVQEEHHPQKERSQSRSRDFDRHDRESNRPRDFDRGQRYSREKREKKEEAAEPEADPERDQRTVFAFQGCWPPGKVRDVRLIMDRNTRRSRGVGYIEFYDAMSVPMAIALTGQLLCGQPVMVKPSEAEKNLVQSTSTATSGAGVGPFSGNARRVYVGNLHFNIGEEQLRQVFDPFGPIELVQLPIDPDTGHHKGYGFVQYTKLEDASAATALNGTLELAGRVIKVVPMTDQGSMPDSVMAPGELDDDDGGGLSLTAGSRALLMQKLDRSGTVQNVVSTATQAAPFNMLSTVSTPVVTPVAPGLHIPGMVGLPAAGLGSATLNATAVDVGSPSECMLLRNMFDPSTETDPDFDVDIKEEVQSECTKYGAVKHIFVDKNSAGHVYLRFSTLSAAMNAQKSLYGRWFAGKMITTSYMTSQAYEAKFPDSR